MNGGKKNDEVDLLEVFIHVTQTIRANKRLLVLFVMGGLILGYLFYLQKEKSFESKMQISSTILSESICKNLIDDLYQSINVREDSLLWKKLNLTKNQLDEVRSLEVEIVEKSESFRKVDKPYLIVTARVADLDILPQLQNGLINYLASNEFAKVRREQRIRFNRDMIKRINEELAVLEEFKTRIYKGDFFKTSQSNIIFDPTKVNTEILNLTKEKLTYENELEVINDVQVLSGFTLFNESGGRTTSLIFGFFIGVMAGFAFIFLRYLNKLVSIGNGAEQKLNKLL